MGTKFESAVKVHMPILAVHGDDYEVEGYEAPSTSEECEETETRAERVEAYAFCMRFQHSRYSPALPFGDYVPEVGKKITR